MAEYRDRYLTFDTATDDERREFLDAQDKVMRIALHVSGKRRFLSKNPPHTGRIRMLLERYPGAKFIYLVRNPYAVYESTHNFFTSTLEAVRMQAITSEELDREILLNYRALYEHYENDKRLIPDGQLFEVRFEDLEAAPARNGRTDLRPSVARRFPERPSDDGALRGDPAEFPQEKVRVRPADDTDRRTELGRSHQAVGLPALTIRSDRHVREV